MRRPSLHPVVWQPPAAPARAKARSGPVPLPPLLRIELDGAGPEDVVVDAAGRVVTGVEDGRLLRIDPDGGGVEVIADTGGRPLGIELLGDGRLLVCDARRGLLAVDPEAGAVEVLVDHVAGEPMRFCNNAAVAADQTVYFSESSRRFGVEHWLGDVLEHSGTGRLLRRDPGGAVEVLLDGLQFANGVALGPGESFVAVAELGAYRLTRLWLAGERAGERDVLADNLPGFPDNLADGSSGLIWVALGSPRNPLLDRLHRLSPVLRRVVWALPQRLRPAPEATVWVQAVDQTGRVVHDLQGPADDFGMVSGVREHDGRLYLGSFFERAVAVLDLPAGTTRSPEGRPIDP
jgi:sugar lactone lactonase YvrE